MFARPHMAAGMNEFLKRLICAKTGQVVNSLLAGIVVALVFRRKQLASEFVLIRRYTIKQLNTLIVMPII